jgi:hypothetical protein
MSWQGIGFWWLSLSCFLLLLEVRALDASTPLLYANLILACAFVTTWENTVIPEFARFREFKVS